MCCLLIAMLRQMDTEKEMNLQIFIIRRITASASPNARNKGAIFTELRKSSEPQVQQVRTSPVACLRLYFLPT